jgi:pimeloyl-ACP methyl ester carboxylesterase
MIQRLVLLPGMHGTGELFSEFMKMIPEPKHIEALHYPTDVSPSYSQLLGAVEFFVPASEDFVLLAESYSTPLAIQFAATDPPNLKGLILCAGFAASPIRGWRKLLAWVIAPLVFRLPCRRLLCLSF